MQNERNINIKKGTEKLFDGLEEFLSDKNPGSEEQLREMIGQYMEHYNQNIFQSSEDGHEPETADDFLEIAEQAESKRDALKYAKQALKLEPDNIDAQTTVAVHSASTSENLVSKLKEVVDGATSAMKENGYFSKENIGEFWLIPGTRPYMRLLSEYAYALYECSGMKTAAEICREMLRLCEGDNLGMRYMLVHIYAHLEDEESALELMKQYDEDSTQFLLPMSILYYKAGRLQKSSVISAQAGRFQ